MGQFVEQQHADSRYLVWVPDEAQEGQAIVFLHGKGESGANPDVHRDHSLGRAIQKDPDRWPYFVVFPQKLDANVLWPGYWQLLSGILRQVETDYGVDTSRCHLMGLSQGGNGALCLANSLPWKFRTVTSMCGWADPGVVLHALGETPLWLFHGQNDRVVPASCSQSVHEFLAAHGRPARLTLYPDLGHNCWDRACAEPNLPLWLADPTSVLA